MDAFGGLTPSQAIRSTSGSGSGSTGAGSNSNNNNAANNGTNSNSNNDNTGGKTNKKRRNKKKNAASTNAAEAAGQNPNAAGGADAGPKNQQEASSNSNDSSNNGKKTTTKRRQRNNNNKKASEKNQGGDDSKEPAAPESSSTTAANSSNAKKNGKKNNSNNKKRNNRKKYPWRKHIPAGTMDPITLDALVALPYPPFALRASAPYLPAPAWPPKEETPTVAAEKDSEEDAKERERRLLQEQWGSSVLPATAAGAHQEETHVVKVVNPGHLNLFDGRALAYYMVSQLQFIDPLNRRDLARDELCHLDRYLMRNGFSDLNVVEAYDTKGVSLSTAGAASTTAAGRVDILQQEARVLLNALFGRGPVVPPSNNNSSGNERANSNPLMQQYSNYQATQQQHQPGRQFNQQHSSNNNRNSTGYFQGDDTGIYGDEEGGMMVIDDDLNPSLRGGRGLRPFRASPASQNRAHSNATTWSASRIPGQHAALQADNFPALSTVATVPSEQSALNSTATTFVPEGASPAPAPARAPAAARVPKKPLPKANTLKFITKAVKKTTPEEAQRQFEAREEARRKAVMSNLTFGSNPASWDPDTQPSSLPPSHVTTDGQLERNRAFADALGVATTPQAPRLQGWARPTNAAGGSITQYPDSLILKVRENMAALLKVERKWKTFLEDDKAASLPLNKMDWPTRQFVHEYSDYWKLHTESFDPEPNRYIHCVKLLDTSAPYPLLSDAARQWRGPTGYVLSTEHSFLQTAGQDTRGGEVANSRAAALASERPKLELKERTIPLELPPFQQPSQDSEGMEVGELLRRRETRAEDQQRKQQEREELKQKTLLAAFASDSEEESLGEVDADIDWEEGEALYAGGEEEDYGA